MNIDADSISEKQLCERGGEIMYLSLSAACQKYGKIVYYLF